MSRQFEAEKFINDFLCARDKVDTMGTYYGHMSTEYKEAHEEYMQMYQQLRMYVEFALLVKAND